MVATFHRIPLTPYRIWIRSLLPLLYKMQGFEYDISLTSDAPVSELLHPSFIPTARFRLRTANDGTSLVNIHCPLFWEVFCLETTKKFFVERLRCCLS